MDPEQPASGNATKFPIVGIGASAGGLEALEALTKRLSRDGMAFVVLQHLAPGHESALTDILARGAKLPVVTVKDGMRVEVNRLFVAPPNFDMAVHQGILRLTAPPAHRRGPRLSIDALLRSLAADQGSRAIGVILSGAGADGTLGLKAIKDEGGITFVQEPSTASQPSMPQSALDAGYADFCLSPGEIADELMGLSSHPYVSAPRALKAFDDEVLAELFALLSGAFGVDFTAYKLTTLERRVQRRMALHKLDRLQDYVKYVQVNIAELNLLYSDLLIGVSGFFRDKQPFESLKTLVFPRLFEQRSPDVPIRVWVAGCSTGEEAFSIGIGLVEYLGERAASQRIQIFATDVDEDSLVLARQATYPQNIEVDVSPERLKRFFVRADKGYRISRPIRDMVVFARHNLGKDAPFSRMDLLSCRNVLIYMQPALQKKALRLFHYALKAEGFLLLGTSESVGDCSDIFSLVDRRAKIYTPKNIDTSAGFDISFIKRTDSEDPKTRSAEYRPAVSVLQLADRKVIEQYGPPGVVVNEKFDILQYRGKTGRFFEPTPGIATTNLIKLVRPELLHELRPALHKAYSDNVRIVSGPIQFFHDREIITVRLDVTPLPDAGGTGRTLLVMFSGQPSDVVPVGPAPTETPPVDLHVQNLERELAATKDYLQTTIEALEATNQELQSSNEELQSSNEEMQSTNEELETSKEELQSTNEELATLNEELQNRLGQLNVSNDDLQNLLRSADSAIVIVNPELRIRLFSVAAERLLNLIPGDVGRSIAYIRTVIKARDIEQAVAEAISAISVREHKVRSVDGHWYTMRITPYQTAGHAIRGAVIEFVEVMPGTKEIQPRDLRGLGGAILATVPFGLALLDEKMCINWGNNAFLEIVQAGPDIFGRPLEDLWGGKAEQPDVWRLLEDAALEGRPFAGVLTTKPFGTTVNRPLKFAARRLPQHNEQAPLTLIMVEEARGEGTS